MDKLISVVTGFYNRGDFVKSSVGSLLKQTYKNIEVIVFDDCSTDSTYEELLKLEDQRLKIIRHQANVGFVTGLINAIRVSRGDYIAIHGAGDVSYPDRLEKQYELLSSDDEIGVVGCDILNFEPAPDGRVVKSIRKGVARNRDRNNLISGGNIFTHGEVMIKRKYYDLVGGYRKAFYFSQDRDLWLRLIDVCRFDTVDEVLYERIYIPNSLRFNYRKVIIQKKYSELARQCAEMRTLEGTDLVDQYGIHAVAFIKSSRRLSSFYYRFFFDYLHSNTSVALETLKLAVSEKRSFLNCISYYLISLVGIDNFSSAVKVFDRLRKDKARLKHALKDFFYRQQTRKV